MCQPLEKQSHRTKIDKLIDAIEQLTREVRKQSTQRADVADAIKKLREAGLVE